MLIMQIGADHADVSRGSGSATADGVTTYGREVKQLEGCKNEGGTSTALPTAKSKRARNRMYCRVYV